MYRMRSVIPRLCRQAEHLQRIQSGRSYRWGPWFEWRRGRGPWEMASPRFCDERFRPMINELEQVFHRGRGGYRGGRSAAAEVKCDDKSFLVKMDVCEFEPEHVKLKIKDDRLVISAKHEQKADDHGFIAREITREIVIPKNIDSGSIDAVVTEEGMLTIQGRVKGHTEATEKVINIERG